MVRHKHTPGPSFLVDSLAVLKDETFWFWTPIWALWKQHRRLQKGVIGSCILPGCWQHRTGSHRWTELYLACSGWEEERAVAPAGVQANKKYTPLLLCQHLGWKPQEFGESQSQPGHAAQPEILLWCSLCSHASHPPIGPCPPKPIAHWKYWVHICVLPTLNL